MEKTMVWVVSACSAMSPTDGYKPVAAYSTKSLADDYVARYSTGSDKDIYRYHVTSVFLDWK